MIVGKTRVNTSFHPRELRTARAKDPPARARLVGAVPVLFCLVDDTYRRLNPEGVRRCKCIKKLSGSEALTLALLRQLRGVQSERSFLRDAEGFFSHLSSGVVGLAPSSFHRLVSRLRGFLEPLRRSVLPDLAGDPETLIVDSTLLPVLHPRQVEQSAAGFEGRRGCGGAPSRCTARSYTSSARPTACPLRQPSAANVADALLVRELPGVAGLDEGGVVRRHFGNLAYRGGKLKEELAEAGVLLAADRAGRRPAVKKRAEVCSAALKRVFGMGGTLAKTPVGLVTRIAAKVAAYACGLYVNRLVGKPHGRIKAL